MVERYVTVAENVTQIEAELFAEGAESLFAETIHIAIFFTIFSAYVVL